MSWLARLKKTELSPNTHPTKPTKPPFVGFVGSPAGTFENSGAGSAAANDATGAVAAIDLPDWRELDQAYQAHHWTCPTCQAAGRGAMYGRRCTVGLVLWAGYSGAAASV